MNAETQTVERERWRRVAVRIVAWTLFVALSLAVAEVAARFLFVVPEVVNFSRIDYSEVAPAAGARASLANAAFTYESAPDEARFVHHLNQYGFRDRAWTVHKTHARRVLFVGDSFVEGFMASDAETIPSVYERIARAAGVDLEAWNLGVGAAGWPEYLRLIPDAVVAFEPDEVVLVLYANDMLALAPLSDADVRAPLKPMRRDPLGSALLATLVSVSEGRMPALARPRPPFPFFAAVPNASNPWSANGEEFSRAVEPSIAAAMRDGRFNPFVVNEPLTFATYLPRAVEVGGYMEYVKRFLDRHGVAFRVVYLPYASQVSDYYGQFSRRYSSGEVPSLTSSEYQLHASIIAAEAARLKVPFLDLTPILLKMEDSGRHMYWNYDEHMRAAGYAVAAAAIWDPSTVR